MKDLIKKLLREAVGVPANIDVAAENLYKALISKAKNATPEELEKGFVFLNRSGKYNIADFKPKKIILSVRFGEFPLDNPDNLTGPVVPGMQNYLDAKVTEKFKITNIDTDQIKLKITFAVPEGFGNIQGSDFVNTLIKEKSSLLPSLAHELMHAYNNTKYEGEDIGARAEYGQKSNLRVGLRPMDHFMYGLYLIHNIENIVRPTEVFTGLKGTDKKEFLKNFQNLKIVKELMEYRNYSFEDLKNGLKSNMKSVNAFLKKVKNYPTKPKTDDEKVNAVLDIVHNMFMSNVSSEIQRMRIMGHAAASQNPFDIFRAMFSGLGITNDDFEKIRKRSLKFGDDYESWYKYEIKRMNKAADEVIRKVSKVYSLMGEEKKIQTFEIFDPSSFDMDQLYRKLKKRSNIEIKK